MGDQRPCHAKNSWIAFERSISQFRQHAIEVRRQIDFNLADLRVDDMKIVEQPFGRWRDRPMRRCRANDGAIAVRENFRIVIKPRTEQAPVPGLQRDALGNRETFCVLFQSLGAEQLGTNGRFGVHRLHRQPQHRSQ